MSTKRVGSFLSLSNNLKRRKSVGQSSYFEKACHACGLIVKCPPEKCEVTQETVYIVRNLYKSLKEHDKYPQNVNQFITDFENLCKDMEVFEHYLYLNIVKADASNVCTINDSVLKILLNVTFLQSNLIDYIFDKAMDIINEPNFESVMKMILRTLSELNMIKNSDTLSNKLIDLLDVSSEKSVRLEIISAIPSIIGDQEHDNVATKISRILTEGSPDDRYLIPSILDCLAYLCLSDSQYEHLQKVALQRLYPSNAAYFSNFVRFLLPPDRLNDSGYEETIKGLRQELAWSSLIASQEDLATSQVLTATAIRNSMLSSKTIAKTWLKVLSSCDVDTDHKPIDIIFLLILYSVSEGMQKQVDNLIRREIKLQILKEDLLEEAFKKFKPILKHYLLSLISLSNTLLKVNTEPLVQSFASHLYLVMFSELPDCCPVIVSELLQLVLNNKQSVLSTLNILNDIAVTNLALLKSQSLNIMTLLDRMDDMTLTEIRAVMNLVCGLAFSFENLGIRNDVHVIITKALGSSIRSIKIQGILAGIHAIKYLTRGSNDKDKNLLPDNMQTTLNMTSHLPEGDLREAGQIIEHISHSTRHFPDMTAFFYDELYKIIEQATDMKKTFMGWLVILMTNDLLENFIVGILDNNKFGEVNVSMQLCLNEESEVDQELGINIAGIIFEEKSEVDIEVLSPLFQLVRILHYKNSNGNLSSIDAILGLPIVLPNVDIDSIENLSESSVTKILDCYIHCVNWIRELLNAFAMQKDEVLKPRVLHRLVHLKKLEKNIEEILLKKPMTYKAPSYNLANAHLTNVGQAREQVKRKPPQSQTAKQTKLKKTQNDDSTQPGKSQQTQVENSIKNKLAVINNIPFRSLNLDLIHLLRYDLSPDDSVSSELTFEILCYLLSHLNCSLEIVLVPRLKRETPLSKASETTYSRSYAETRAQIISETLPKIIDHVDIVTSYLECHIIEENEIRFDTLFESKLMECCQCLEHLYNLLRIYFRWIEFKVGHPELLKTSLSIVAKITDTSVKITELITIIMKNLQNHAKYCLTISCAVALMELLKALQEHATGSTTTSILKDLAYKFLSKQWKTTDDQLEKGLLYNQGLDSLIKVYWGNIKILDIKDIVTSLAKEVESLCEKTSTLITLKSINKSNFCILFRNLGIALADKIKSCINGGLTNYEHVQMWETVSVIIKVMSNMVTTLDSKNMNSVFLNLSVPILNLFLSKGFPVLEIEFENHRQLVLNSLKDFQTSAKCWNNICSQFSGRTPMNKTPAMKGKLTKFFCKTKDLLKTNNCSDDIGLFNVTDAHNSKSSKKKAPSFVYAADETVEDSDDNLPEEDSDIENDQLNSVGISDMV